MADTAPEVKPKLSLGASLFGVFEAEGDDDGTDELETLVNIKHQDDDANKENTADASSLDTVGVISLRSISIRSESIESSKEVPINPTGSADSFGSRDNEGLMTGLGSIMDEL